MSVFIKLKYTHRHRRVSTVTYCLKYMVGRPTSPALQSRGVVPSLLLLEPLVLWWFWTRFMFILGLGIPPPVGRLTL